MKKIPIGLKDYRKLKEENYYVVDKSLMKNLWIGAAKSP